MIFISGIHGVGKSYFCNIVKDRLGIGTFSASQLIAERKQVAFSRDKLIPDIDINQQYLLAAVEELNIKSSTYLLDGHFCLLDAIGQVSRIPIETFTALHPEAIVLLTEKPEIIAMRRKQRDNIDHDVKGIHHFQNEEIAYATEVAELLDIPLKISTGASDLDNTLCFMRTFVGRDSNGR